MNFTNSDTHEIFTVTAVARITFTVGTADGIMSAREAGEIACSEIVPHIIKAENLEFEVETVTPSSRVEPDVRNFVKLIETEGEENDADC